jgi:alanyl-tRNA synthetase
VRQDGSRWLVTLDRSAFYPTGGGQPCDTGRLDEAAVLEVFQQEDGTVAHAIDRELEKNARVRGQVDWSRRFDHMQQHTGQHLLSAAFEREIGAATVSFHLGASRTTIDLDREVGADEIARVEEAANTVVWNDRNVSATIVSATEAARLPLRRASERSGDLRLIEIEDYDLSACGGTHVCRTGAIGMIDVIGWERVKGGMRVEFACGARVYRTHRDMKEALTKSVRLLSVLPADVPAAIEKLQSDARLQQKQLELLERRLTVHDAAAWAARGQAVGQVALVAEAVPDRTAKDLKAMASSMVSTASVVAVLLTADPPFSIVIARSADVALDAGVLLRGLLDRFGGKGGGRGSMAQAAGLVGDITEILATVRQAVAQYST